MGRGLGQSTTVLPPSGRSAVYSRAQSEGWFSPACEVLGYGTPLLEALCVPRPFSGFDLAYGAEQQRVGAGCADLSWRQSAHGMVLVRNSTDSEQGERANVWPAAHGGAGWTGGRRTALCFAIDDSA